jgi:arginine decarboxylase
MNQNRTPLFDAVRKYIDDGVIPFHVPGHKQGRGLREMADYIGERALKMDLNGMEDLDFANNPTGVILEAQELMAHAYGAEHAYFLVNGTTSGVLTMILSACDPGSRIIIPRNAHRSTIGGIILSGAMPVYVLPEIDRELGITMGISAEKVRNAIRKNPHAKAVFIINPTYYGMTSDIKSIVRTAHMHDMSVIVDEAHGAHMMFHDDFPLTAMEVGADMSAVSMHKTAGSLTQSSVLLSRGALIPQERIRQSLGLAFTSSASYLLMCSLDISRKQLATRGEELLGKTLELARWARDEINRIPGLYAFGRELTGREGCFDFDETKLGVNIRQTGYTGYQVEALLRERFNIQVEMSDLYNILAVISIGDRREDVAALVNALRQLAPGGGGGTKVNDFELPENLEMIVTPRDAFYNSKKTVRLEDSAGEIAGEMVMAYPPGIPVICLGERITRDVIDYIMLLKQEKCELQGTYDPDVDYIRVLGSSSS